MIIKKIKFLDDEYNTEIDPNNLSDFIKNSILKRTKKESIRTDFPNTGEFALSINGTIQYNSLKDFLSFNADSNLLNKLSYGRAPEDNKIFRDFNINDKDKLRFREGPIFQPKDNKDKNHWFVIGKNLDPEQIDNLVKAISENSIKYIENDIVHVSDVRKIFKIYYNSNVNTAKVESICKRICDDSNKISKNSMNSLLNKIKDKVLVEDYEIIRKSIEDKYISTFNVRMENGIFCAKVHNILFNQISKDLSTLLTNLIKDSKYSDSDKEYITNKVIEEIETISNSTTAGSENVIRLDTVTKENNDDEIVEQDITPNEGEQL